MTRSAIAVLFNLCLMTLVSGCNLDKARSDMKGGVDPCSLALVPHSGEEKLDRDIRQSQDEARTAAKPARSLEKLGWLFVSKARVSFDTGYYRMAEQCAKCIEGKEPGSPDAMLLRGHVLHNLHKFKEAEKVAEALVALRGAPFDHGLLGDVLMEQGRLREAATSYQKMISLKPCLQSYSRAAHFRWLRGDLDGAITLMTMAARAGSPADAESTAWAYTRLAVYQLQAGKLTKALQSIDVGLSYQAGYAPALLARGRVYLAEGNATGAVVALKEAARINPLPEYLWALAEGLRAAGREREAQPIERELVREGPANDPRTLARYLATRGQDVDSAVHLAEEELSVRQDVFTYDAVAWALGAAGKYSEARSSMERALSQGTKDARLFYHAGVIAAALGQRDEALRWFEKAASMQQMLLPSEREQLSNKISAL